jgi:sugar phosphate isomerase/epimerase
LAHRFGISTHLFHAHRLDRTHLNAVAAHGFETIEVYATRTHFDYHDAAAAETLGRWLEEAKLPLHALHAPTTMSYVDGVWGETVSIGAADEGRRRLAVEETRAVLRAAAALGVPLMVLHLGPPSSDTTDPSRASVARSLTELAETADSSHVRLALEVIPNRLSTPSRLVQWLEEDLDGTPAGICLDVGHANLGGDCVEAVETCSGHIVTTHLHDNHGADDDHLVPGEGTIDWPATTLAFQKVGYDGAWVFELKPAADPGAVLVRARAARRELERLLTDVP